MSLNNILQRKFFLLAALTSVGNIRPCVRWRKWYWVFLGWGRRRWRTWFGLYLPTFAPDEEHEHACVWQCSYCVHNGFFVVQTYARLLSKEPLNCDKVSPLSNIMLCMCHNNYDAHVKGVFRCFLLDTLPLVGCRVLLLACLYLSVCLSLTCIKNHVAKVQ